MEGVHGVDVSWLHHSPKDISQKDRQSVPLDPPISQAPTTPAKTTTVEETHSTDLPETNGKPQSNHHLHRPHLHTRPSVEKSASTPAPPAKKAKEPKSPTSAGLGRRNSWMTSISSKFSSSTNNTPAEPSPPQPSAGKAVPSLSGSLEHPNPFGAAVTPGTKEVKGSDVASPPPPAASPRSGHPGFLQSALRRLSSGGGASMGKMGGTGGICERKVMNKDPYRSRCEIAGLKPSKLRRVAFCVDVEIAAPPKYHEQESDEPEPPPPPRRPSLTQLEHHVEAKKKRDQRLRKSEGEALKNPAAVTEEKETTGIVKATGENVGNADGSPENPVDKTLQTPSRKKEKKKRSEEERKERKEKKRVQALENGSKPVELTRHDSSSSAAASPPTGDPIPKSTDRPTTDPLRIYRRCCQLRETPILKRITEQISSPSACPMATPGIISCLDLTGFWMQLPDIITLGDYLAVVPVKKLILEDCGLGDEAVRVILAGLLAAKTTEQAKHNKKLAKRCYQEPKAKLEQLGVVERLSLKNNAKIGVEGWRHVSYFINMSRSLKAIDLSGNQIPQPSNTVGSPPSTSQTPQSAWDIPTLLQKSIAERQAGSQLEELVMGECALSTDMVETIIEAVIRCRVRRLGLAHNDLSREGLQHVVRYLQLNFCEGLDLGGNDLREHLFLLAEVLDQNNPLYALSLADCKLSPSSISSLLPSLVRLPNFRFIDLSHNRDLFATRPNALGLLRKYLPQLPIIKRVHLMDTAMTSEHAIALAEILPEIRTLAHLNILENHLISGLASARNEVEQEEACALYASLMAAVRVSKTIVCIDIDVPSEDSSEIVRALAKQVVAYSLRNMESLPLTEGSDSAIAALADPHGGEKHVSVPDVLLHLVGHVDGVPENHDHDDPAPDDDYIVGGTGVVKALGICLNRAADQRKGSRDMSPAADRSGTMTPTRPALQESEVNKGKAKEMSVNLLGSARKIRARLQPALVREGHAGSSSLAYKRLQYLAVTLDRMIQRFENEYPETRIDTTPFGENVQSKRASTDATAFMTPSGGDEVLSPSALDEDDLDSSTALRPAMARHPSDHPHATRQDAEEGLMHRFGQRVRREMLPPDTLDYAHGTTGEGDEPQHMQELRMRLESLAGGQIQRRLEEIGPEQVIKEIGATKEELLELERRGEGMGKGQELIERTAKMPFTKLVKNSAYYSRYQTKYKRRRQGKTDYYARKRLITQAKNKYNAPKYRLVVRFTNRDIICQIVTSEITGDKVFCAAYSHELRAYGIEHGLTNWAAAYATGLLIARRVLKKLELDEAFTGVEDPKGEYNLTEAAEVDGEDRRPFKCFLDVGLKRTSTGARIFGAMKGASDGGILIPHSENRFPGYDIESKELDAETLRKYIFGGHVAEYMETLADDDEERYKSQFSQYIEDEIEADGLEEMYTEAHKGIREDPWKKDEAVEKEQKSKDYWKEESKKYRKGKDSKEEKMERVKAKIQAVKADM
ncbi:MAG: hypothetical protein Q9168_003161 [Polycauliona sp. 1 TL-2023]